MVLFVFLFGLILGSFLNVVIYRSSRGMSLGGRSICPKCKHVIAWYYNIPLLSFLFLRGRCAYCHKKISLRYPAIELLTGLMFVWWYVVGFNFFNLFGNPWTVVQPIFWLLVGMVMLTIFMTDLFYGVIPLGVNIFLLVLVLFYRVSLVSFGLMQRTDFVHTLLSGVGLWLFFVILQKLTRAIKGVDGLGGGDITLSPALGLLLGYPKVIVGTLLSFVIGAIFGSVLMLMGKKKMSQTIPFGPFLVVGTALALLFGNWLWEWYFGMLQ